MLHGKEHDVGILRLYLTPYGARYQDDRGGHRREWWQVPVEPFNMSCGEKFQAIEHQLLDTRWSK